MRIDKYISNGGYFTRKEVKKFIRQGRVFLNGNLVKSSNEKIDFDNKNELICNNIKIEYKEFYYFMINKPQGVISATKDEINNYKTIMDLVDGRYKNIGLFPVGRLDIDTEGLIILSNNGKFFHNTLSPKNKVEKTYFAHIDGIVTDIHIKEFADGIVLEDGYRTSSGCLEIISVDKEKYISKIKLTITEGKYHQVKRMFQAIDKNVIYLKRIMFAKIKLDDNLDLGDYRELNKEEMDLIERYL